MNQLFVQLVESLDEFKLHKMFFKDLYDDKQSNINLMVKIVKNEVIDIADSVEKMSRRIEQSINNQNI